MSDVTLGQLITTPQKRDAIHVAVAPVIAATELNPGDHVGFIGDGKVGHCANPIGIVDPFLKKEVFAGEEFWLFLYPKSTRNLRHDWDHPAFEEDAAKSAKDRSIKWIERLAGEMDISYDELMDGARGWLNNGTYLHIGTDTPYEKIPEFWVHYNIVTGNHQTPEDTGFVSCAC